MDALGEQEARDVDEDRDCCEHGGGDWEALDKKGVDNAAITGQQLPPSEEILRIFGVRRAEQ